MESVRTLARNNSYDYIVDNTPGTQGYGKWTSYVHSMNLEIGWKRGATFSDFKRINKIDELLSHGYEKVIYIDRDYLANTNFDLSKIPSTTVARFKIYSSNTVSSTPLLNNRHGSFICEDKNKSLLKLYDSHILNQTKLLGRRMIRDGYFGKRIYEQIVKTHQLPAVDVCSLLFALKQSFVGDQILYRKELILPYNFFHLFENLETYQRGYSFGKENFEQVVEDIVKTRYDLYKEIL